MLQGKEKQNQFEYDLIMLGSYVMCQVSKRSMGGDLVKGLTRKNDYILDDIGPSLLSRYDWFRS